MLAPLYPARQEDRPFGPRQKKTMTTAVSIVIPAYNEEKGIGPVLTRLLAVMDGSGLTYEVVVVNDGSRDDTAGVTGRVAAEHERLTLLQHRHNRGYGAALKTGIRHARYDLICITDADGTYPNERIPELVAQLAGQEYDMVVGARTGENVAIPLVRRPAKWAIGRLANYVAGEKIPDLNSGLRVFRREIALRMFGLLPNAFSFTCSMKERTTGKATSASSSAMRTSRMVSLIFSSLSRPCPRSLLSALPSRSVRLSNMLYPYPDSSETPNCSHYSSTTQRARTLRSPNATPRRYTTFQLYLSYENILPHDQHDFRTPRHSLLCRRHRCYCNAAVSEQFGSKNPPSGRYRAGICRCAAARDFSLSAAVH